MPNINSIDFEQEINKLTAASANESPLSPTGLDPSNPNSPTTTTDDLDADMMDFKDFNRIKVRLDRLISDFAPVQTRTANNRMERFKDINLKALRDKQELKDDQYLLPVRAIESNIRREQPAYINYLKQSRRLLIFKDVMEPLRVTTRLEDEFSRGMTYSGWEIPQFKCIDGSQTHGWDAVEVVFDTKKPLQCGLEHIGNDRLIFPTDAINIQDCEIILKLVTVTSKQLKRLVKEFGFSPIEVKKLLDLHSEEKKEATINIYKKFCKYNNVVYTSWFSCKCDDWLKPPEPMYLGREQLATVVKDVPAVDPLTQQPMLNPLDGSPMMTQQPVQEWQPVEENMYPIFILPYNETEQTKIVSHKGRVFLDKPKQEAKTANLSQFLNGCQRGSTLYPSLDVDYEKTAKELQSIKIGDSIIPPVKLKFYSPPYPDAVMLNLQQYLDSYDAQEVGQINFAALNRKDSRKTATEVSAANEETSKLNSVQLTLFSTFIREVYSFAWEIVKSRAAQEKIVFLVNPETGTNDIETVNRLYDIRAAGDVDVVKRSELIQQYKEFWPIIQNTALAPVFLGRLIRLVFPDEGDMYAEILMQDDPRILLTQMAEVLRNSIDTEELNALDPQAQQNLMMLLQKADMITSQQQQMSGNKPKPQQGQPQQPPKQEQPQNVNE